MLTPRRLLLTSPSGHVIDSSPLRIWQEKCVHRASSCRSHSTYLALNAYGDTGRNSGPLTSNNAKKSKIASSRVENFKGCHVRFSTYEGCTSTVRPYHYVPELFLQPITQ